VDSTHKAVEYFLSAYFHQDWDVIYDWNGNSPNFDEVVRFFKVSETPARLKNTISELQDLLATFDEEGLKLFSKKAGVAVFMKGYGLTYRQWLEGLLKVLKEPGDQTYLKYS
jgi:hypothetical protein